jgi:hypothetical protein
LAEAENRNPPARCQSSRCFDPTSQRSQKTFAASLQNLPLDSPEYAAPTALKFQHFCDAIRVHPCLSVVEKI